jgi:hypothetical protein
VERDVIAAVGAIFDSAQQPHRVTIAECLAVLSNDATFDGRVAEWQDLAAVVRTQLRRLGCDVDGDVAGSGGIAEQPAAAAIDGQAEPPLTDDDVDDGKANCPWDGCSGRFQRGAGLAGHAKRCQHRQSELQKGKDAAAAAVARQLLADDEDDATDTEAGGSTDAESDDDADAEAGDSTDTELDDDADDESVTSRAATRNAAAAQAANQLISDDDDDDEDDEDDDETDDERKPDTARGDRHQCRRCDKVCSTLAALRSHEKTHAHAAAPPPVSAQLSTATPPSSDAGDLDVALLLATQQPDADAARCRRVPPMLVDEPLSDDAPSPKKDEDVALLLGSPLSNARRRRVPSMVATKRPTKRRRA